MVIKKKYYGKQIEIIARFLGICIYGDGSCATVPKLNNTTLRDSINELERRFTLLENHFGIKYIQYMTEELPRYEKIKKIEEEVKDGE